MSAGRCNASDPQDVPGGKVRATCPCGEAIESSGSMFGRMVVAEWVRMHRPKPPRAPRRR